MRSWVKWCVNHKMKFVVYLVWFLVLPLYMSNYVGDAAADAMRDLNDIKKMKGE